MIEIKRRWQSVTNRGKWAARGASFVARVKATKVVWFPPTPAETGRNAAPIAEKSTKRAAKKTTGAALEHGHARVTRTPARERPARQQRTSGTT
jgi:hypothetical protein